MGWFDEAWKSVVDSNPFTAGLSDAVHNVGESSGINDVVDKVAPYAAAAAAIYLTGGALAPEAMAALEAGAAAEGMTAAEYAALVADSAPIDSAMAGGGAVGGGVDVANGYYGFGSGTSLSADAAVNPLNPFYGTANPAAQANLVGSNLIAGGADANLALLGGNPLLPVSGAGLGGGLSASSLSGSDIASNLSKLSKLKGGTTQKQLANALRLPTDLNTNVAVYKQENPFYYSPQQQLANMLKV